jgi:hypothetical protein
LTSPLLLLLLLPLLPVQGTLPPRPLHLLQLPLSLQLLLVMPGGT